MTNMKSSFNILLLLAIILLVARNPRRRYSRRRSPMWCLSANEFYNDITLTDVSHFTSRG